MGYSCTKKAMDKFEMIINRQDKTSSNTWKFEGKKYLAEIGRERDDGAVVGTISKIVKKGNKALCYDAGRFHIEPDGKVRAFPHVILKEEE